jgi:hypothetical protein
MNNVGFEFNGRFFLVVSSTWVVDKIEEGQTYCSFRYGPITMNDPSCDMLPFMYINTDANSRLSITEKARGELINKLQWRVA